jgi:hypothetical protein
VASVVNCHIPATPKLGGGVMVIHQKKDHFEELF